ncbi:MAG: hypothetical protein ACYCQJ_06355 [Nitrososphaerales archaeon]
MATNQVLTRNEVVRTSNGGFILSLTGLAVQLVSASIIGTMFFLTPAFSGYGTYMPFGDMMGGYYHGSTFGSGYGMFGSNELGSTYIVFWVISIAIVGVLGISGLLLMKSFFKNWRSDRFDSHDNRRCSGFPKNVGFWPRINFHGRRRSNKRSKLTVKS